MMRIKSYMRLLFGITWLGLAPALAQQPNGGTEKLFFYHHDHLGSTTYVTDENGDVVLHIEYLPSGEVFIEECDTTNAYATPYKFNGKELDEETGLYYYGARYLHPKYGLWLSTDPLEGKSPDVSSYCYTMGNPIRLIDPIGTDTLDITFANGKWSYSTPIIAKGNDIFRIHKDNRIGIATFEGGNSLNLLNLFVGDDKNYTLGIYHISGSSEIGSTGFYVAPGGKASIVEESKRRIPDGTYPMTTPEGWEQWRQPGIGGSVKDRGIRFHFGYPHPLNWTEGCFILSSDYSVVNNNIEYNKEESRSQVRAFDFALGASKVYDYRVKGKKYMRIGASFSNPINRIVHIKSLKQNWQK